MEYFLVELQYQEYAAKEEMIESLTSLSEAYCLPDLTLEQVQVLNELSLATVGVYVTKVTSSIAKAWADFKAGFQDGMWISFKKIHGETFNSDFVMMSAENGITIPNLEKIKGFLDDKIPDWNKVKDSDIPDKAAFYKIAGGELANLYDEKKSIQDKVNEMYFIEHKGSIKYESKDLVNYIKFMNEYSKLEENIAADIKSNSVSAKNIKAQAENAQAAAKKAEEKAKREQEKAKQDAEKAKAEADKAKADAEREAEQQKAEAEREAKQESTVFNFAESLLEAVLWEEGNKFEPAETPSSDTPSEEKPAEGPLSDEDFKAQISKITIFFSGCSEILSAKMKALNKARSLSFDLIKQYCKLAEGNNKEKKKADKEAKKNQKTDEKPTESSEEKKEENK